ncbi:hypothetical protein ACFLRW_03595 [Acidobacteriota bacterium]
MTNKLFKNVLRFSVFFIALTACVVFLSMTSYAAGGEDTQYSISIDVSSNIINLDSERWGDIRIFTSVRYSLYAANGHKIFVYFNESNTSVENIRASRDSLGNLILRFSLEDLMVLESKLRPNELNDVEVVVSMDNGDEYIGETKVFLNMKR